MNTRTENMNPAQPNEETIFEQALSFASIEERTAYLRGACAGNEDLRRRVESLINAHEAAGSFLVQKASPGKGSRQQLPSEAKLGDCIGRYKLLQQIGEGGCGVVYMAEQEEPVRRRIALKIIKLGMDTKSVVARFEAERQALALMDHPNIAKALDAGSTENGRPYFVMELVRGTKITDYCDEKNLSTQQRLDLFIHVCQAIQHAHQKGIIHRDIKPSNILVTVNDGVAVPKVIDFGIAKATTDQRLTDKTVFTAFEQFIGTPAYMSPEQTEITSVDVDTRSDIYSLGVLLYELLTGKTPFDPKELLQVGLDEMRRTIREKEPQRPSTRVSTLGGEELTTTAKRRGVEPPRLAHVLRGDLDWIVMKCLEKDRARRYETANGVAMDIQRHLSNEPVAACPPSNSYRFQKMVRRNKGAFAVASSIAAALVLGLCIATWGLVRERQARSLAVAAEREQGRLRRQSETEAAKSLQVAQFLQDMLRGAGPEVAKGRDATILIEILDKTAQRISQELTNQPAIEADLSATIGSMYWELGKYAKAEAVLKRAIAIYRQLYPEGTAVMLDVLGHYSQSVYSQGRFAEAERLFRETLDMTRKINGNKNAGVANALHNLAEALNEEGKLSEAKVAALESLELERRLPEVDQDVAGTLNQLGNITRNQGSFSESETFFRQALALWRKYSTNDDRHVEIALNNLALALKDERKFEEAEDFSRQALAMDRRLLGNAHPEIIANLNNLATILAGEKKLDEAEAMGREALAIITNLPPGQQGVGLPQTLHKLSDTLRLEGKQVEAENTARQALATARKLFGDGGPQVGAIVRNLANIIAAQGRYGDTEELYSEFLSSATVSETARGWVLAGRGEFYARRCRWEQAAADLTRSLEVRQNDALVSHWLVAVLVQRGDLEKYRERCRKSIDLFATVSAPVTVCCVARDCAILPSSGADLETAGRLADVALSAGTNHPDFATCVLTKGLVEYRLGHFDNALASAGKAFAIANSGTQADDGRRMQCALISALAHYQLQQNSEARKAMDEALDLDRTKLPKLESGYLGEGWLEWVVAHALLSEAKGLFDNNQQH